MHEERAAENIKRMWKRQEGIEVLMSADEVCRRAHQYERKAIREYSLTLVLLGFVVAVVLIYIVQIPIPLVRLGNAIGIATLLYIVAIFLRGGPPARLTPESQASSCSDYLRGELRSRYSGTLKLRWAMLGLLPASALSLWGGGPPAIAEWWGLDWLTQLSSQRSPYWVAWLAAGFLVLWLLGGRDARKIKREIDRLGN